MAPDPFVTILARQDVVLLDGGLATALEARGQDLDDPLWSARVLLDAPEVVRAVHLAYLEAGADCISTATYQATFEGLRAHGLTEVDAEAALLGAVRLAVEARDDFWRSPARRAGRVKPLVAASIGPYGAYLADGSEYTGHYDRDEDGLVAFHRRRWFVLATSSADMLACETIPSLAEVRALVRLLDETPGRWAWISFQCRDDVHLADGSGVLEAVAVCNRSAGVAAIGFNCVPPGRIAGLLSQVRRATDKPLMAYPNSGEGWDPVEKAWLPAAVDADLAEEAPSWRALGARVLGGCCRTGPDTIRRMRAALLAPPPTILS